MTGAAAVAGAEDRTPALRRRRLAALVVAAAVGVSSVWAVELVRHLSSTTFQVSPRSASVQLIASEPLPESSSGYLLQNTSAGYSSSWSLFLGTWPKDEVRIFVAAFGIANVNEDFGLRITKLDFVGLAAEQENCIYAYLHRNPRLASNVTASASFGLPATARETLGTSSLLYFDGPAGPVDRAADGWVLSPGHGYGGFVSGQPTTFDYSNDLGATLDTATFDTAKGLWIRDGTETQTNGLAHDGATGLTTDPSTTQSNFAWVDVTVDTRRPSCAEGSFSTGSIEVFLRSV